MSHRSGVGSDPEISAISGVYETLKSLNSDAQLRVLNYVMDKLSLRLATGRARDSEEDITGGEETEAAPKPGPEALRGAEVDAEETDGISPAGRKWMKRNDLTVDDLSAIFSIGGEEIDLILKKVPGDGKAKKMRSVFLLKGLAAYLASGAARFAHKDVKETLLAYDAFDAANFAKFLRGLSAEISGSKDTGYSLVARGLASATAMVKQILGKAE